VVVLSGAEDLVPKLVYFERGNTRVAAYLQDNEDTMDGVEGVAATMPGRRVRRRRLGGAR
jgi:hypothetical protein